FLFQGCLCHILTYALVPVITVQLGEPVTLTCALPDEDKSSSSLYWYKQSAGKSLKLILTLMENNEPVARFKMNRSLRIFNFTHLMLLKTMGAGDLSRLNPSFCLLTDWLRNSDGTSNYTVVEQRTSSDPDRPGGSVSLQCSVLSDSEDRTCSGGLRVFWFRSRSDKSYPDIIYADGNRHDEREKKPDSQKRCVFSKNIISSDAGTYYCAVATCGQIIFGKGIKIEAGMIFFTFGKYAVMDLLYCCLHNNEIQQQSNERFSRETEDLRCCQSFWIELSKLFDVSLHCAIEPMHVFINSSIYFVTCLFF
uniref:Ig-like domain-containing protein n=1 Tax=Kryptolebias marmoratus TaxID=37003 RepID=A0A3Q3BJY7_KRYMA